MPWNFKILLEVKNSRESRQVPRIRNLTVDINFKRNDENTNLYETFNCTFITWPKTRKTIGDVFLKFFQIQIIVKYKNKNKKPKF